ncbi:MAG: hypothetical protein Q9226_003652 [Calogaya cf. arnoldii]
MASLGEICGILGRSWNGVKSSGRPSFIRKHVEEFAHHWSGMKDKAMMSQFFLSHHGKKLFGHAECSPKLPEHHDEILGLVAQAFRLLPEAQYKGETEQQRTWPESDSTIATQDNNVVTRSVDDKSGKDNRGVIDEQLTLKAENNNDNTSDGIAVELFTSAPPDPIACSSKIELVKLLKDWIDSHPNLRIPELAKYERNSLEDNFAIEASLVETGARVWIIRLGVIDMYQGWVLEKSDGSKVLVKAQYRKGGHVYYGWLGGELGYSDKVIAHHEDVPRQVLSLRGYARKQHLDPEDVLNEYDLSRAALEPGQTPEPTTPATVVGSQESDTDLASPPPSDSDDPLVDTRASRKRPAAKQRGPISKKQAKISTFFPTKSQIEKDLLSIDDDEVRGKVKQLHKVFPTVTVAVCECVLLKNKGDIDHAIDDLYGLQNVPSSTDATVSDDGPPAKATRSRRAKLAAQQNMPRTPSPTRTKSSSTIQLGTPFLSHQSPSFGYPTPQTPSICTRPSPTTTFQFFLSDPSMGAIPIPFNSIKTKQKFFTEAITAHFLTSHGEENESVVAASVVILGMGHPIVVRRKNGNPAWEEVGRVVKEVEKLGEGAEVEVRCVVQPVVEVVRKRGR